MSESAQLVETRHGPARLLHSSPVQPWVQLVLGHSAGGGPQARDLRWLADDLPGSGVAVIRVEQPWRVSGGRVAARAAVLDEAWIDALEPLLPFGPLVVGGRSAGARVACRTAMSLGAVGCVALAFPLMPPWNPDQSRFAELAGAGVPTLVLQGDRDSFGSADDFPALPPTTRLVRVVDADHSFAVRRGSRSDSTRRHLVASVLAWLHETVPDDRADPG